MQWWIGKVPTCRSHIDNNNNNQATDHNKLVKENADRITCSSNLYNTYNRAMDRMEHRGGMVTKSPAATAGLIYICTTIEQTERRRLSLAWSRVHIFYCKSFVFLSTSSLELVFRTDLFLLLLQLRVRSLKKVSRKDMSQKESSRWSFSILVCLLALKQKGKELQKPDEDWNWESNQSDCCCCCCSLDSSCDGLRPKRSKCWRYWSICRTDNASTMAEATVICNGSTNLVNIAPPSASPHLYTLPRSELAR